MVDSDDDYIGSSGDDRQRKQSGGVSTRNKKKKGEAVNKEKWEEIQRSWDNVVEGEDGSIASAVYEMLEKGKRKRLLRDTTPLQRGIIRHLVLLLDLSTAMEEKDFRPTRYLLTLRYAADFVKEFFEQNPISQVCVLGMRDGLAVRISDMSGNVHEHVEKILRLRAEEPKGSPSLQNGLEMARGALYNVPTHATREVLVIFGALHTCDPGDIHQTINSLVKDNVQARVVGLAAQMAVCKELVKKTNSGSEAGYGIALNESHYRDLIMSSCTPPLTRSTQTSTSTLLTMGFPSRVTTAPNQPATLCACHSKLTRDGYNCPRCRAKVCSLPMTCPACSMTLILSTHLARSYHHLFPLGNWVEVGVERAHLSKECFACQMPFPPAQQVGKSRTVVTLSTGNVPSATKTTQASSSSSTSSNTQTKPGQPAASAQNTAPASTSRYECPRCEHHFCIDCDIFSHEEVFNCPGCEGDPGAVARVERKVAKRKAREKEKAAAEAAAAAGNEEGSSAGGGGGGGGEPMVLG